MSSRSSALAAALRSLGQWVVVGAAGLVAGCAPSLPAPSLTGLSPDWACNQGPTEIALHGDQLFPGVEVSGGDQVSLDRDFRVRIHGPAEAELVEVDAVDFHTVEATVPAGLPAGVYDVELLSPSGEVAHLEAGLTVTDSRADHLVLSGAALLVPSGSTAALDVQVADRDGGAVGLPLEVLAWAAGEGGEVSFADTLEGQQETAAGVRGFLNAAGHGRLAVATSQPGMVQVHVAALDPDAVVPSASLALQFVAGPVNTVEVGLPDADFVVDAPFTATVALRDADGNPTEGVPAVASVRERCNVDGQGFAVELPFVDRLEVEAVAFTAATRADGCAENGLEVSVAVGGGLVVGASAGVVVAPGSADHLRLDAWPGSAEAGLDTVYVDVDAVDRHGNPTLAGPDEIVLADSADGLIPDVAGSQRCSALVEGRAFCEAVLWHAGEAVEVRGLAVNLGLRGSAAPVEIRAGAAIGIEVAVAGGIHHAGDRIGVEARGVDTWGNTVALDGAGPLRVRDAGGVLDCIALGTTDAGASRLGCTVTYADGASVIEVRAPALGVEGSSAPVEVRNGPLSVVDLDLGGVTEVMAGDNLRVRAQGYDAWGNPYLEQAVVSVELDDSSGTIAGLVVPIDPMGGADATLRFTKAWRSNQISASVGRVGLGRSAPFDVVPGPTQSFLVETAATYTTTDVPLEVEITAQDAFGNVATAYAGSALMSSVQGLGPPQPLVGFSGGALRSTFPYALLGLADNLRVVDGSTVGTSDPIDVVDLACAAGPAAALEIDGKDALVACRTGGSTATSVLSAAGSEAGAATLAAYHFRADDQGWTRSVGPNLPWVWTVEGGFLATVLVVDADACAAVATVPVWVADDDGEPAGPVTIRSDAASLTSGATGSGGQTTVHVQATDCAGDVSVGGTVSLRASRGDLLTGTSALVASGAGLEAVLDGAGEAAVTFSAAGNRDPGEAIITVGVQSGAAYGAVAVEMEGDNAAPTVLRQDPVGTTANTISRVTIEFSEAMWAASATPSSVVLTDPTGQSLPDLGWSWSADGRTLTLLPPTPIDAGLGAWTVALSSHLADIAGNRVDGQGIGLASAYQGSFGTVPDGAPDALDCAPVAGVFRPDGDDGVGEEADDAYLNAEATGTPTTWALRVTDEAGAVVARWREAGVSSTQLLSWSGRDQTGAIVDNGLYSIEIAALDTVGNAGSLCVADVWVDNLVRAPE